MRRFVARTLAMSWNFIVQTLAMAWKPLLMVAALVGLVWGLRQLGMEHLLQQAGDYGVVPFMAVGGLLCAVALPRQMLAYGAGLAYGFWPGVAIALVAEVGGCAIDFWGARAMGRNWATRFLSAGGGTGRVARFEQFLVANAFSATLTIRLLPFGSNVGLNLVAGVSRVRALPFLLASVLGFVPQTVIFALLGEGVRVSEGLQLGLAAGLLVLSVALGLVLLRRRPSLA